MCCRGRSCGDIIKWSLIIGIPIVVLLAIIGGLLGGSAKDLNATNVGLEVNGNTNQVYYKLYQPGRYFLHLNHYFLEYTKQMRSIVFSDNYADKRNVADPYTTVTKGITARTNQGLTLTIGCALHYQIGTKTDAGELGAELKGIFENFGDNGWEGILMNVAKAGIMDAIAFYQNEDFYQKRQEIGQAIYDQVSKDFMDFGFSLRNVFVLQISVVSLYDTAIQDTEIKKQEFEQIQFQNQTLVVQLATNELLATFDKRINIQRAASLGYEAKTLLEADAQVLGNRTNTQISIIQNITTSMGFTSDSSSTAVQKVLSYYWIKMLSSHQAQKLVVTHDLNFITG